MAIINRATGMAVATTRTAITVIIEVGVAVAIGIIVTENPGTKYGRPPAAHIC
jgi:hypothetical protein